MSRRSLVGIISSFFLIGSVAWWASRTPAPREVATTTSARKASLRQPKALPPPAATEALPEFGTEAFNQLAKERGAGWMASRNRDAVSLLAMWDLTGDGAILREAAEKFPGNPQVCLAMLALVFKEGGNSADQKQWTDHMTAADPDNPLGYYYQARLAVAKGVPAAVVMALEQALRADGRIDHYLRERMTGAKEGLLASGVSLKDTYFLSLAGPMGKSWEGVTTFTHLFGFFRKQMEIMKASGRETEYQDLAALGLRIAEQQRLTHSPTLMTELLAHGQRIKFLKDLDPTTEIANSGSSVAEELVATTAQKEKLSKMMKEVTFAQEFLQAAPLEVQGHYADRMMMEGEMAAMKYLVKEMARQKP